VGEPKTDLRPGQSEAGQQLADVPDLGGRGAQELAARRGIGEQIGHLDARPGGRAGLGDFDDLAVAHDDASGGEIVAPPRHHRRLADGPDAGQRLAAKAEGADAQQIVDFRQLAGGVPRESAHRVVAHHPLAVVDDGDEGAAGLLELDDDARRAGVERVLDQLLDDRRRPLDDLAGGDLVGDDVGQHPHAPPPGRSAHRLHRHQRRPHSTMAGRGSSGSRVMTNEPSTEGPGARPRGNGRGGACAPPAVAFPQPVRYLTRPAGAPPRH
jgi:hypothetical protein